MVAGIDVLATILILEWTKSHAVGAEQVKQVSSPRNLDLQVVIGIKRLSFS